MQQVPMISGYFVILWRAGMARLTVLLERFHGWQGIQRPRENFQEAQVRQQNHCRLYWARICQRYGAEPLGVAHGFRVLLCRGKCARQVFIPNLNSARNSICGRLRTTDRSEPGPRVAK